MTDNIRRVWFLKSEYFRSEFQNCSLVYIPYWNGYWTFERMPNFRRLLEILEVSLDKVHPINKPTKFDKIVLPDESFLSPETFASPQNSTKGFTEEYREAIEYIRHFALKNRTPTFSKKIYFFNGRKGVGEERIAEYFKTKGYEVFSPEKLTLDEQLNLLVNAESFASVGCSCAHNSLFLRDSTETIFIPRAASRFDYYQEIINQVHPVNSNYVDSSLSICSGGVASKGHFYLLSKQLKRFFGDKADCYEEEDIRAFLTYIESAMSTGLAINQQAKEYYAPTLSDFLEQLRHCEDLIANIPFNFETLQQSFSYQTHVAKEGWGLWAGDNRISNLLDQQLDIQAIRINFPSHKVCYSVFYNDKEGWSSEVTNGQIAGTTGKSKSIYGVKIRLDEAGAKEFDILYRIHKFDGEWTAWAKNGEEIISNGVKLNAIQIKLESKT